MSTRATITPPPKSHFVPIGRFRMHATECGEGPPLVMIHGLGSSSLDWERQIPVFARSHRVIAVDLRGHGRSDTTPPPTSVLQLAADVRALLRGLRVETAHVLGLSLGGMVGFQLALDFPEMVRSFTVVNSSPELVVRSWKDRLTLATRLLIVRGVGLPLLGALLARRLFPEPHQARERALTQERIGANDKPAYLATLEAIVGWSVRDRLSEISCPVCVITGDQDYTSVGSKREWAAEIPNACVVVIPRSRHATPIDQPDRFNHAVLAFLAHHT